MSDYTITGVVVAAVLVTNALLVIVTAICQLQYNDACQSPKSMQVMLGGLGIVGFIVTITSLILLYTRSGKTGNKFWLYVVTIMLVLATAAFFLTASASAFNNWACEGGKSDTNLVYIFGFIGAGILLLSATVFGRLFIAATKTKGELASIELSSLKSDREKKKTLEATLAQQTKLNSLMASLSSLNNDENE
jgi:small-conductance mechanosensitive channel